MWIVVGAVKLSIFTVAAAGWSHQVSQSRHSTYNVVRGFCTLSRMPSSSTKCTRTHWLTLAVEGVKKRKEQFIITLANSATNSNNNKDQLNYGKALARCWAYVESSTHLEDFALQIQQPAVLRYTFGLWNENIFLSYYCWSWSWHLLRLFVFFFAVSLFRLFYFFSAMSRISLEFALKLIFFASNSFFSSYFFFILIRPHYSSYFGSLCSTVQLLSSFFFDVLPLKKIFTRNILRVILC